MIRPLFLDVETVPAGAWVHRKRLIESGEIEGYRHIAPIDVLEHARDAGKLPPPPERGQVPSNLRDPVKIEAKRAQIEADYQAAMEAYPVAFGSAAVDYWRSWSLLPSRCEIATVSWSTHPYVMGCEETTSSALYWLEEEIRTYRPTHIVAWNAPYDCAVLHLAALRSRYPLLAASTWMPHYSIRAQLGIRRRECEPLDLMAMWHQVRGKGEATLDTACRVLGVERENNPIHGSEVFDAFMQSRMDEIKAHNKADVRDMQVVWDRLAEVAGVSWDGE